MKESIHLQKFLFALVSLGNVLNAGDPNLNRADGFNIEFLTKLAFKNDTN